MERVTEGLVVLYSGPDSLTAVPVTPQGSHQSQFGEFFFSSLLGHPLGQRFYSSRGLPGYVVPLRPSPELLAAGGLAHRTQLVHSSDASFIVLGLELRAGHRVVEAGTGSGSLSSALARVVGESGKVFSFEFHAERAAQAREAFASIGNGTRIEVTHRDVCELGFELEGRLGPGEADACFLDLPAPWTAVAHAQKVLKAGASLCCYSPCLEQVMKTCNAMRDLGMLDIYTVEVRQHPWEAEIKSQAQWNFDADKQAEDLNPADRKRPKLLLQSAWICDRTTPLCCSSLALEKLPVTLLF